MTTIVFDRRAKVLVADTRGNKGGLKTRLTKLQQLPDGSFFAGCGSHSIALQVYAWIADGRKGKDRPQIGDDYPFEAIVIRPDGSGYLLERALVPIPIEDDFIAIGSGGDFAMGAMAVGKSALEAIAVAAELDAYTGGPFHIVDLGKGETEPKPAPKSKKGK